MRKHIIICLVLLFCLQCVFASCSASPKRPTGMWETADGSLIIDFADGYTYDDMSCSLTVGDETVEYDISFAVVEQLVFFGKLSYDEIDETPVFYDDMEFSYSYDKDCLILKVNSSSSENFHSGQEIVLNPIS